MENMGIKVVSGDISLNFITRWIMKPVMKIEKLRWCNFLKMPNGMTVGAFTFKSEDDKDVGEEYTASGAEIQYNYCIWFKSYYNCS